MFSKVTKSFSYQFKSSKGGLYSITIEASCKSGKILGLFGGEDLRIEIDGFKLREIPAKDKPQYFNIPPSWNGTKLKGLSKIIVFILRLKKGEHIIRFIPKRGAIIKKEPEINLIKNTRDIKLDINQKAEDGNRRPWITLALINLPLKTLDASVTCEKRKQDSDDVKLIINGKIQKNNQASWWGKNWYWQGRQLKGDAKEARFIPDLPSGIHYIEFWADRIPTLNWVELELGDIETLVFREKAKVVWELANLRKKPNTSSLTLAKLKRGKRLEILQKAIQGEAPYKERGDYTNIWHKVKIDKQEGFIFSKGIEIAGEDKESIKKIITKTARELGVDADLMIRLAQKESEFFPYGVSEDEAKGIFQLMSITIQQIQNGKGQYGYPLEDPFDIKQNIQGGIRYFKWLYEVYYKNEPQRLEKVLIGWNWRLNHTPKGKKINWQRIPSDVQEFVEKILEKSQNGQSRIKLALWITGIFMVVLIGFIFKEIYFKEISLAQTKEEFQRENLEQTKVELFSDLDNDGKIEKLLFEEIQPEESIIVLREVNVYLREKDENNLLLKNLDGQLRRVNIIDLDQDGQKEVIIALAPSNRILTQVYTFTNNQLVLIPIIPEDPAQGFFNRHGIKVIDLEGDGIMEIFVPQGWFYTKECEGQGEIYKYYDGQFVKFLEAKEASEWCREFSG